MIKCTSSLHIRVVLKVLNVWKYENMKMENCHLN